MNIKFNKDRAEYINNSAIMITSNTTLSITPNLIYEIGTLTSDITILLPILINGWNTNLLANNNTTYTVTLTTPNGNIYFGTMAGATSITLNNTFGGMYEIYCDGSDFYILESSPIGISGTGASAGLVTVFDSNLQKLVPAVAGVAVKTGKNTIDDGSGNITVNGLVTQNTNQLNHYIGYQINPLNVSLGTYWGYLLLAKAYTSGNVNDSEVQGTFTFSGGENFAYNRTDIFSVHSKSAYQTEYFVVNNLLAYDSFFVSTVKITYNNIVYHAIKLPSTGGFSNNLLSFDGYATNAGLTIVQSNDPNLNLSSETPFGNVGIFSNSMGYIGIGTPIPSQPLEVNGSVQIDGSINSSLVTSLSGTTAGSVQWSQYFQGQFKAFAAQFIGYENDSTTSQTITFPTPFVNTPVVVVNTTGLTITVTTTTLTIGAPDNTTTYSGIVEVKGF